MRNLKQRFARHCLKTTDNAFGLWTVFLNWTAIIILKVTVGLYKQPHLHTQKTMRNLFFFSFALLALSVNAQTKAGGITPEMLSKIEKVQQKSGAERAISNAIATNNINDLAKNPKKQGAVDNNFCIETTSQSIHNQKSSGRCWMFTGMNVLRSRFAKLHDDSLAVEFSHDYTFFYDQLEKSNLFLQGIINTASKSIDDPEVKFFFKAPLNDGGTFCGIIDLTAKYGLVPKSVMPETYQAENTRLMSKIISAKLREYGLELRKMVAEKKKDKVIETRKTAMLSDIYRLLCMTLGEPVKEFSYAHRDRYGRVTGEVKTYTPQSFYQEVVGAPMEGNYVMLMNDPRHPYYKVYEVEYDRHTYDGHNWRYINLPMEDIESIAIASLKDNNKMYSSYDLPQMDRERGYMDVNLYDYATLFSTTFPMNKAERISTFESMSAHAMTLTAVDLDKAGKPLKWKVENSWGSTNGQNGCAIMTDEWFREYMFRLVVEKKYVPENILKIEKEKSVMISYDDPLFGYEE